jgi:hypothetical protein
MNETFNIIEYLSGLTMFTFDKAVLQRIALERGVDKVTSFDGLESKDRDLLRADLLYTAYLSPNVWASSTHSHGSYTKTVGSQTIYAEEKERLYNTFVGIYRKYEDEKLQEIQENEATLQWLSI